IAIIAQQLEAVSQYGFLFIRKFQLIDRLMKAGVRIGIRPKSHSQALEILHHLACREMGSSIESHVLKKMRYAPLFFRLIERSRLDQQTHADTVRWLIMR